MFKLNATRICNKFKHFSWTQSTHKRSMQRHILFIKLCPGFIWTSKERLVRTGGGELMKCLSSAVFWLSAPLSGFGWLIKMI